MPKSPLVATLLRGAGTALGIQIVSVVLIYSSQVLLAQWMGATDYGAYDYAVTLSMVLAFLAGLGLSSAVLRFVPEYTVQQDWARLRGVIWGSWWQTLGAGLIIAAIAAGVISWVTESQGIDSGLQQTLWLGAGLVPLVALMKLQLELARSIRSIFLAYAPSLVVYPLLLMVAALVWVKVQGSLTSAAAIGLSIVVLSIVLAVQFWLFHQVLTPYVQTVRPIYALRQWLVISLPMLFIDGSFIVLNQTDTLMIGGFLGTKAVGVYGAAFKTAGWVSFILVAVNAIAAPMFATLYAEGDRAGLQQMVSAIARWMFYPALVMALGLFIFAEPILSVFGSEFVVAKWAVMALAVGQLVNVGAGSVGYLLNMTGHQNQCARVIGYAAVLNLVLNLLLIPLLGVLGAAIATAISMSVWNIWLNRLVVKHLDVNPSIVAAIIQSKG
ncbi:MAG: lipopolysaccharide biosynthesis protein [Elainellaceae cyanobacterium]